MADDDDPQELEWRRQFARNLRVARERARLTQADLAEALGITETVYARYERAKIWPSIGRLRRLCGLLDCSADVLLGHRKLEAGAALPAAPEYPRRVRRLLRQLREVRPETVQGVHRMLDVLDRCRARPAPDASAPAGEPDNHDDPDDP
jgi:transcriptional regulator with XRE-family HTH domain